MNLLTTIPAFLAALGCLIVVHEMGHYLVARWCGVKVLRFSIGFGRPLWLRRYGPDRTEWVIAAFPLGGYVKMLDEREGVVAPEELPRSFNRQSVGRRFAIVAAGPVANLLLAVFFYWVVFVAGVPGLKPVINSPIQGTAAEQAGFVRGDELLSIGSEAVSTWQDARWLLLQEAVGQDRVDVVVQSEAGARVTRTLDLSRLTPADLDSDFLSALGLVRYQPVLPPVVGHVVSGGVAARAGLMNGDEIAAVDGRPMATWEAVVEEVRNHPGKSITLEVIRGGVRQPSISLVPEAVTHGKQTIGRIGAGPHVDRKAVAHLYTEVRYGPLEAAGRAALKTWDTAAFSLRMLGKMVVGEVSLRNLSGPITIADYAGQSAQNGWIAYCMFLALISISLGVLNLLPVPLLDGGHLMYYTFEVLKGSPVSERAMEFGQQVGMALLFVMMAFALYNDINRLISG